MCVRANNCWLVRQTWCITLWCLGAALPLLSYKLNFFHASFTPNLGPPSDWYWLCSPGKSMWTAALRGEGSFHVGWVRLDKPSPSSDVRLVSPCILPGTAIIWATCFFPFANDQYSLRGSLLELGIALSLVEVLHSWIRHHWWESCVLPEKAICH